MTPDELLQTTLESLSSKPEFTCLFPKTLFLKATEQFLAINNLSILIKPGANVQLSLGKATKLLEVGQVPEEEKPPTTREQFANLLSRMETEQLTELMITLSSNADALRLSKSWYAWPGRDPLVKCSIRGNNIILTKTEGKAEPLTFLSSISSVSNLPNKEA